MRKNIGNKFGLFQKCLEYFFETRIPIFEKLVVLLIWGGYIISPIDILPDTMPLIGWIDDIGISALAMAFFNWRIKRISEISKPQIDELDNKPVIDIEPIKEQDSSMPKDFFRQK